MSEKSEKWSETMSDCAAEAQSLMRQIAGESCAGESVKAVLRRVHRQLADWTASRVKDVWYADPRVRIRGEEMEKLRALAKRRAQDKADTDGLKRLQHRISRLEAILAASEKTMDRARIASDQPALVERRGGSGLPTRTTSFLD